MVHAMTVLSFQIEDPIHKTRATIYDLSQNMCLWLSDQTLNKKSSGSTKSASLYTLLTVAYHMTDFFFFKLWLL